MFRNTRIIPILLLATFACSDDPTAPDFAGTSSNQPAEAMESIPGILESARVLRAGDRTILLAGEPTALFEQLVGAEMLINGTIDPDDGALIVHDFFVLAIRGLPVLDGTIESFGGSVMLTGWNGDVQMIRNAPEGLREHEGRRVWVAMVDGEIVDYGTLEL